MADDHDALLARASELSADLWSIYGDQVICCNAADALDDLVAAVRDLRAAYAVVKKKETIS